MSIVSETLRPPYFAAIVSPREGDFDQSGMLAMEEMISVAPRLEGFLGLETARLHDGTGAAICYWKSVDAVTAWKSTALSRLIEELNLKHRRLEDACAITVTRVARRLFGTSANPVGALLTRDVGLDGGREGLVQ